MRVYDFSEWIPWLIVFGIIAVIGISLIISIKMVRRIRAEIARQKAKEEADVKQLAAEIETEMIQDQNKREDLELRFNEYIRKKHIYPDQEGRYFDPTYGFYITPAILEASIRLIKPIFFLPAGNA